MSLPQLIRALLSRKPLNTPPVQVANPEAVPVPKFVLSARSEKNLQGVHPDLVQVIRLAITITEVDFGVIEGLRTRERQQQLVASGASKTMNSRHLTGHAVDLLAYVGANSSWDWPLYYRIADAVKQAACRLDIPIVWGGVWDKTLNGFDHPSEQEVTEYAARQRERGKSAFLDGPHFELDRAAYP